MKTVSRRKKLLINPEFQISFLKYFVGAAAAVSIIYFGAGRLFFSRLYAKGLELGLPENHVFFQFVAEQKHALDVIFIVTSVAVMASLTIFGLFLSNRVAGPLHRLKTYLNQYRGMSNPPPLAFRKGDYFTEVAEIVNQHLSDRPKNETKRSA